MVFWSQIWILDYFSTSLTIVEWGILGDLSAFSYSHRPIFTTLRKMTDADKIMNPQHFGNNSADDWIKILINPEICIRIPDHFWLS